MINYSPLCDLLIFLTWQYIFMCNHLNNCNNNKYFFLIQTQLKKESAPLVILCCTFYCICDRHLHAWDYTASGTIFHKLND